jgi:hypothetical protein
MKQRHQRSALAALGHVGIAELADHVDARTRRQQPTVAELPGQLLARTVQDGVAVKTDDVDIGGLEPVFLEQTAHHLGMGQGHVALDRLDRPACAECAAQALAQGRVIGHRRRRPGRHDAFAVGLDDRRVDAVQRGPAHQAERAPGLLCHLSSVSQSP